MINQFSRTELLIGKDALLKLNKSRVCVFGLGGVGAAAVEALARCGIGNLDVIDNDTISLSNINRQILATYDTIGMYKTDAAKNRILSINPKCSVKTYNTFYMPETSHEFDFSNYDYIIDAIDTITGKLEIIVNAARLQIPIISSMGTGNKLNPDEFEVCDIFKTSVCPLAKVMRNELKKRNIEKLKVVFSKEIPIKLDMLSDDCAKELVNSNKRQIPGSVSFVPPVAGYILAGEVIKDLITKKEKDI